MIHRQPVILRRAYLEGREQLIETLKAGKSEALTKYLAAVAKFYRYSAQNILPTVALQPIRNLH
jgi:hypothetical protein